MSHSNIGRRTRASARVARNRNEEMQDQYERRLENDRQRHAALRSGRRVAPVNFHRLTFRYESTMGYSSHSSIVIGLMNISCVHCGALKFKHEPPGLCCASGKVMLFQLQPPPEYLRNLLLGETHESKHFLANVLAFNSCFQMTSFGATSIYRDNFMPTFRVIIFELWIWNRGIWVE